MARSRQFVDRISDVLLRAAACCIARSAHCYGTRSRCEYVLIEGMIRVIGCHKMLSYLGRIDFQQ